MNIVLLVLLLAQGSQSVPGNAAQKQDQAAEAKDDESKASAQPAPAAQTITVPVAQPAPPQEAQQPANATYNQVGDTPKRDGFDIVNAFSTLVIALLTLVLVVVGVVQIKAMRAANAHIRAVERAYVGMSHHPPGLDPLSVVVAVEPKKEWQHRLSLRMKISNNGNTPARITRSLIQFMMTNAPFPEKPDYDETFAAPGYALLAKGDSHTVTIPYEFKTTGAAGFREALKELAKEGHRLYVIGYVDYRDKFGGRHRSGYGRVYSTDLDDPARPEYQSPAPVSESGVKAIFQAHRTRFDLSLYMKRNNLSLITIDGYNYDRERLAKDREGNDWDED